MIKDLAEFGASLTKPLLMLHFEHPRREDVVAIMCAADRFEVVDGSRFEFRGAVTGLAKLRQRDTGRSICVVVTHQWHPSGEASSGHLEGILRFVRARNIL